MKHDRLCAIGHNLADSLASGCCFVIGLWEIHVFREAVACGGSIEVDFINGRILGGACSDDLRAAVTCFAEILPSFCRDNGADRADFAELSAIYYATGKYRVSLKVVDRTGKQSITEYAGLPLKRVRTLDSFGRVRRLPRRTTQIATSVSKSAF